MFVVDQSIHARLPIVLYFRVFQMSTIPRLWSTALKLGCVTNFDTLSRDGVNFFD